MIIRRYRFPAMLKFVFRDAICRIKDSSEKVYLTFDDGPSRSGTREIVDTLKKNNVYDATFFCNGSAMEEYPQSLDTIIKNGFTVANHGYYHIDGWKSKTSEYFENTLKGFKLCKSGLFRPPYGHIGLRQYLKVRKITKIVFWDLLLYDFDTELDKGVILKKAGKLIRGGSIIVLHDKENGCSLRLLDELITLCRQKGYDFGSLTADA